MAFRQSWNMSHAFKNIYKSIFVDIRLVYLNLRSFTDPGSLIYSSLRCVTETGKTLSTTFFSVEYLDGHNRSILIIVNWKYLSGNYPHPSLSYHYEKLNCIATWLTENRFRIDELSMKWKHFFIHLSIHFLYHKLKSEVPHPFLHFPASGGHPNPLSTFITLCLHKGTRVR